MKFAQGTCQGQRRLTSPFTKCIEMSQLDPPKHGAGKGRYITRAQKLAQQTALTVISFCKGCSSMRRKESSPCKGEDLTVWSLFSPSIFSQPKICSLQRPTICTVAVLTFSQQGYRCERRGAQPSLVAAERISCSKETWRHTHGGRC